MTVTPPAWPVQAGQRAHMAASALLAQGGDAAFTPARSWRR